MQPKIYNIPSNYDGIVKKCISTLNKFSISGNNVHESNIVPYDSESSDYSGKITKILSKNQYKIRKICSKPSHSTTISVDRKWLETYPPIWDDGLMKDYAECIVEDYFIAASSRKEKKKVPSKQDEEVPVRQEDLIDEVQATWEPVQKEEKIHLSAKKSSASTKTIAQKSHKKSTSKVSRVKIVAPIIKKQKEKQQKPEIITKLPKKPLKSPYRRFASTTNIVDFSTEHPNLTLKFPADDTVFPRRCKKIVIDNLGLTKGKHREKKGSKSKESILKGIENKEEHKEKELEETENKEDKIEEIDRKDVKTKKIASIIQFEDLAEVTKEVDDTWHNMLSKNKPIESSKILHYTAKEYDEVPSKQISTPKQFDIIYDSARCAKTVDKFSSTNLKMQTMPILSIRGDCRVQKAVKISIDSKSGGNVDIDETDNVHYFEFSHRSVKDKKRILEEAENAIIDWENITENINITSRKPEGLVSQSSHGVSVPHTGNKYLSPFVQEVQAEEVKSNETTSAKKKERKHAKPLHSSFKLEDSETSQTDEEKIKKRQRIQDFTTSTSSYEINPTTSEEHNSNGDSSHRPELVSSAEVSQLTVDGIQFANLTEVENILEEVFAQSPRKDIDHDPPKLIKEKKLVSVSVDCHEIKFGIDSEVQTEQPVQDSAKKSTLPSPKAAAATVDLDSSIPLPIGSVAKKATKKICEQVLKDLTEGLQKFKNIQTSTFDLIQTESCGIQGERSFRKEDQGDQLQRDKIQEPQKQSPQRQEPQKQQKQLYEQKPKQQHQQIQVELRSDRSDKRKKIDFQATIEDSVESVHMYDDSTIVHSAKKTPREQKPGCSKFQYNFSGSSESYSIFNDHQVSCKPHCCWNIPCDRVFGSFADTLLLSNSSSLASTSNSPKNISNKILQKSGLDKNPKFSRTLNKIYSDASKVSLKTPKHADPEVQRAVKKFLSSITVSQSTETTRENIIRKRIRLIPQTSTSSGSDPLKFKIRPPLESQTNIIDQRPLLSLSGTTSSEVYGNRTFQISPRDKLNSSENTKESEPFESSSFHLNSAEYLTSMSEGEVLSLGEVKTSNS